MNRPPSHPCYWKLTHYDRDSKGHYIYLLDRSDNDTRVYYLSETIHRHSCYVDRFNRNIDGDDTIKEDYYNKVRIVSIKGYPLKSPYLLP